MPLPRLHPLEKTETEIRRSIERLQVYASSAEAREIGFQSKEAISLLQQTYQLLPSEVRKDVAKN